MKTQKKKYKKIPDGYTYEQWDNMSIADRLKAANLIEMKTKDWNEMNIEDHIKHLEAKFKFDSSATAKSVHELINAYRNIQQSKKEANEFIIDIAQLLQMDADGLGYDGLQLTIDDFKDAILSFNEKSKRKILYRGRIDCVYDKIRTNER